MDGAHVGLRFVRWCEVLGVTPGQAVERTGRPAAFLYDLEHGWIRHIAKSDVFDIFGSLRGDRAAAKGSVVAEDYSEEEILHLIDQDPKRADFIDP